MQYLYTFVGICWLVMCVHCDWIENKGLWYYISEEEVDYKTASEQCETMSSRLAVITNDDQNDFLKRKMSGNEQPRWIGFSTIKTNDHCVEFCANREYVWNYDYFCLNNYNNFKQKPDQSIPPDCMGVNILHSGWWVAIECVTNYGYICQWECKTIDMQFNNLEEFNGIYMLHHYWDGNIVYKTERDDLIEIYKSELDGKSKWLLSNDRDNVIATYESESFVPYGESIVWRVISDIKDIDSWSFCIECDVLSLRVDTENNESIYFISVDLHETLFFYRAEVSGVGTVVIPYSTSQLTTCIEVSLLAPTRTIHTCAYIFPYPDQSTTIEANTTDVLYIQNECVSSNKTYTPERDTTSTDSLPQTSPSTIVYISTDEATTDFPFDQDDQMVIPVVIISAAVAVLAIITVVILVLICIVRRRRRRRHTDNDTHQIQNKGNDEYNNAKLEPNVYSEMGESDSIMTNKGHTGSVSNIVEYSYADLPLRETKNIAKGFDAKGEGFLAQDYGALMAGDTNDAKGGNMHNSPHGINAIYSKVKKSKIPSAEATNSPTRTDAQNNTFLMVLQDSINIVKSDNNDDLQLHENDLYMHTTENNQHIEPPANHTYYNENDIHEIDTLNKHTVVLGSPAMDCGYYNVGGVKNDNGEDDLELFENSTYESSK